MRSTISSDNPKHIYLLLLLLLSESLPGRIAQSAKCQAADTCLTLDPGVARSIPVRSHTFVENGHETVIHLPSADSRRIAVSYKRKYVHEVLVTCLVKLAPKKCGYVN